MLRIIRILKSFTFVLYLLPWCLCLYYSFGEAAVTLWKSQGVTLPSYQSFKEARVTPLGAIEFKRAIQKEFRNKDLFVPFEDIVTHSELNELKLKENIRKICGAKAAYYVFLPLTINVPFVGQKSVELCLKSRVR